MKIYLTMFLSLVLLLFAWPTRAEMDGKAWDKQSDEFKRGYAAGQLGLQVNLGEKMTPSTVEDPGKAFLQFFGQLARNRALCVKQKGMTPDKLKKLTEDYLQANPDKGKESIVDTMDSMLAPICVFK